MSGAREGDGDGVEEERLERIGQLVDEYLRRRNDGDSVDLNELLRHEDAEVTRAVREQLDFLGCLDSIYGDRGDSLDTTRLLGDFRILREVGRGGMGLVYEAEQISLGRRVALKVLPLAGILDSRQLERFRNEARAAAQLRHNHIVPIFAVGRERGVHYYAMQFIDGRSLQEILVDLKRNTGEGAGVEASRVLIGSGRQAPREDAPPGSSPGSGRPESDASSSSVRSLTYWRSVVRLALQAASALGYAHEVGIVHRDVKPANLLVDAEGHLWVTDFGLAQFNESTGLTLSGELVGTLSYMSPEQTEGQRALVDQRTDIYSLGATLYELLTLELPFQSSSRVDLIHKIRSEEPRPPRALQPRLPVDYETVVLKAMQKDPAARYRTMTEFAADLDALLRDQPIRARRVTAAERAWRWCRRNRAVATLGTVTVFLLLVVLVALGVVATIRSSRDLARRAETQALVSEALSRSRALRLDSGTGRKDQAMELLGQVASEIDRLELDPAGYRQAVLELRGELVAWSSSYSARVDGRWEPVGTPGRVELTFELCPDFEHYAVNNEAGWVDVYPIASDRRVARVGGAKPRWTRNFFSPSGRYLGLYYLETRGQGSLEVWDWREERRLLQDPSPHIVHSERFGPGEDLFAVRVEDGAHWIVRYDVAAGEAVARCRAPGHVWKLAVHPGGGRVVVTDHESYHLLDLPATVELRELDLGATLGRLFSGASHLPGPRRIMDLDWSPDGRRIACATGGGEILAIDAETRDLIYTARGHQNSAMSVRFNRRGDLLASSSWDGTTRLFEAHTGEGLLVLEGASYNSFTLSPDDLRFGCAHPDRSRHFWRIEAPRILRSFRWRSPRTLHKEGSADVRVSEDGRFLASAHVNAGLRLWDLRRGTVLGHVDVGSINRLHFDPSARSLVTFGAGGAQRWPLVESSSGRWRLGPPRRVAFLPPLPDGTHGEVDPALRYCAAFGDTHLVCVDREKGTVQRFPRPIINTAVSSRGLVALDKPDIGEIWIASIPSGKVFARIESSGSANTRFSPDGRWSVVSSYRELRIFDTESLRVGADSNPGDAVLRPQPIFRVGKGLDATGTFAIAFSPDGRLLAAAVQGRRIRLFAVPTWERLFDIESPDSGQFRTFRFSPDGRLLVTSASNNAIHIWRLDEVVAMLEEYGVGIQWRPHGPPASPPAGETLELEVLLGIENDFPGVSDQPTADLGPRYDRAIVETPSDPELFRQRALWHERQRDEEAALEDFRRAAELSPDSG